MPTKRRRNSKKETKDADNGKGEGSSKLAKAAHSIVMDLADLLKSVLNSGLVAVGDVRLKVEDVEIPIKLRLLVTMIEKAREEGINWWETDPFYSTTESEEIQKLKKENEKLKEQAKGKKTTRRKK